MKGSRVIPLRLGGSWSTALSAVLPGLAAVAAGALAYPQVCVALMVLAVALALGGGWSRVVVYLPTAAVVLLFVTTAFGLAAKLTANPWLHERAATVALVAAGGVAASWVALRRSRKHQLEGATTWRVPVVAVLPGIGAGILGAVLPLGPVGSVAGWFFAGDHLRHLPLVADVWHRGSLDPWTVSYPHGWHGMLAALWSLTTPDLMAEDLASLVSLMADATWFVVVLLSTGAGIVGYLVARRLLGPVLWSTAAGFGASATTWLPTFSGSYLVLGFETTLVGVLVLLAVAVEALTAWGSYRVFAVACLASAVMAHVWPLLLAPIVAVVVLSGLAALSSDGPPWRRYPALARLSALPGLAIIVSAPALWPFLGEAGVSQAGVAGDVRGLPAVWLAAAAVSTWVVSRRCRRDPGIAAYSVMVLSLTLSGLGVALVSGVSPSSYYPNKMLTAAIVLALPAVASLGVLVLRTLHGKTAVGRVAFVPACAAAGLLATAGFLSPLCGPLGLWSTVDGERVLAYVTAPGAGAAQVVWSGSSVLDDAAARSLLSFYRVSAQDGVPAYRAQGLALDCADLVAAAEPVVLSPRPDAEVRARFGCAPRLRVVPVRGVTGGEASANGR